MAGNNLKNTALTVINPRARTGVAAGLLFVLILICYSNAFKAAWHLDDYHSIVRNQSIRIHDLSFESIHKVWLKNTRINQISQRTVAFLTFAVNWYYGQKDPTGYHIVNFMIHFLAAVVLYLVIWELFRSPNLKGRFAEKEHFIALLGTALWAINPIQTQAVTYIVQRMASLATLFYLLGMYMYIKGRLSKSPYNRGLFWLGSLMSFALALGSKENAILLPLAICLLEICFFQEIGQPQTKRVAGWVAGVCAVLILLTVLVFFIKDELSVFFAGYANRPFTLGERLLTELRILIFYLAQIFYPAPHRLSIEHDIVISTALWQPWTTGFAALTIIGLIGIGIWQIRQRPILSFAILFFFLNHLIESSIIPLELICEHRNYLPSLFLFFPLAWGICGLVASYRRQSPFVSWSLVVLATGLLIGWGTGTYVRNMAWATEKSLWEDAIIKAPASSRSYHNLAWGHYFRMGQYDQALRLYEHALQKGNIHTNYGSVLTLNNIAAIYSLTGDYERALGMLGLAIQATPQHGPGVFRMVLALIKLGRWEEAQHYLDQLIQKSPTHAAYQNVMGFILLKLDQPYTAICHLRKSLRENSKMSDVFINLGAAYAFLGEYAKAQWFFLQAAAMNPRDPLTKLYLADVALKAENRIQADIYINKFLSMLEAGRVGRFLEGIAKDPHSVLFDTKNLFSAIAKQIKLKALAISR